MQTTNVHVQVAKMDEIQIKLESRLFAIFKLLINQQVDIPSYNEAKY